MLDWRLGQVPGLVRGDGRKAEASPSDEIRSTDFEALTLRLATLLISRYACRPVVSSSTMVTSAKRGISIILTGMPTKLNTAIVAAAIVGFEEQKKRLDAHIAELRNMLSPGGTDGAVGGPTKRRRMSAAAVPELRLLNGTEVLHLR